MDDNMKTFIDDYTEIEYRYGKVNGQINSLIAMCLYELQLRGKDRWNTSINDASIPAALVLHMLGQQIPQDIADLYKKNVPFDDPVDLEEDE